MEVSELTAICKALIDADPTMSGYHESHIAVKMPYALAVQKRLSSMPKMHTDDMNDIVLTGLALEEAKREIERLRSLTTWQPIQNDTTFPDGEDILVGRWFPGGNFWDTWVAYWDDMLGQHVVSPTQDIPAVATHWMSVPTPPEADT